MQSKQAIESLTFRVPLVIFARIVVKVKLFTMSLLQMSSNVIPAFAGVMNRLGFVRGSITMEILLRNIAGRENYRLVVNINPVNIQFDRGV